MNEQKPRTLGSLFAGIGGFDLGFEWAGWQTKWQVEINPINRAVLADRFPAAKRFADVRNCGITNLSNVDCITAGFPCQDISVAGCSRRERKQFGLQGARSGLFFQALRIIDELQPTWVVFENVPALFSSNDCKDIERIIQELAQRNYLGFARVLDAQFFGVPQRRRRLYLVAGLGRFPSLEFMADAGTMEAVSSKAFKGGQLWTKADDWTAYTVLAANASSRISMGSETLVAHADGWRSMVERARITKADGVSLGLDAFNSTERFSAGNSVCPHVAQWISKCLPLTCPTLNK